MLDSVGVFPEGSGEIGSFGQTEEIDRGVAEGGQVMSASGKTDPAAVLSPMRIANPMLAIFDAPMATPQSEQLHRTCPIGRKTGNGVLDFARGVATSERRAFQSQHLSEARPLGREKRHNTRARLQSSSRQASVSFVGRAGLGDGSEALTPRRGGKIPARNRRQSYLSVPAGCL